MPYKCVVPMCNSNYDKTNNSVSIFSFPADEVMRQKWCSAIPRQGFTYTKYSKVCQQHFLPEDIIRTVEHFDISTGRQIVVKLKKPRLSDTAIPSVFPKCPSYLSSSHTIRESPSTKRERIQCHQIANAISRSLETKTSYDKKFLFSNLSEFQACLAFVDISKFWSIISRDNCVIFINIECESAPSVSCSIVIKDDLQVTAFLRNVALYEIENFKFPLKVTNVHEVVNILDAVMHLKEEPVKSVTTVNILANIQDLLQNLINLKPKNTDVLKFISQQLNLVNCHKNHLRYDTDFLIFSCLVFSISPHAYRFIRSSGNFIFPHPVTLRRICATYNVDPKYENDKQYFLTYIKQKSQFLNDSDKYVTLMIDEIHIKPYFDFKGGSILGIAHNCEDAASSACVFMIQGIRSSYKDVVHIIPVKTLSAEFLYRWTIKIICGLEDYGFKVVCIVSDNNAVNRRAVSFFASPPKLSIVYPHPCDHSRPLFFIIDAVHLLKSVRNNWMNQKNSCQCLYFPSFENPSDLKIKTASFAALKKLHSLEVNNIIKHGYGLTLKSLNPNNLEKQNVSLALQIFNSHVVEGLLHAGNLHDIPNYEETAYFIKIICQLWDILNVRSPYKGQHKCNRFQEPLTLRADDVKLIFLNDFINWLEIWGKIEGTSGKFSRETHLALKHTTYAIIEITNYFINELGLEYVLTGKLQTDSLEDRFGKYRQLAGSQYNVSITQVFEVEKKIRIQSLLPLCEESDFQAATDFDLIGILKEQQSNNEGNRLTFQNRISVHFSEIYKYNDLLTPLTYVAGYCVRCVLKKLNCQFCSASLLLDRELEVDCTYSLIKNLDRGGLKYPREEVVDIILYSYIIICKLTSNDLKLDFLKTLHQKDAAVNTILDVLQEEEIFLDFACCQNGHNEDIIRKLLVTVATNVFLKNFCKELNDNATSSSNKRKLATLKKK